MIYDVNKIPDGGSPLNPRSAQSAGFIDPAHLTQFTERRQGTGGSVSVTTGAFYGMFTAPASDSNAGDIYLQGGLVTGGNGGSSVIANYRVLDDGALPAGILENYLLYLRVPCTATVADGVMMPGVRLGSASSSDDAEAELLTGATIPEPHVFTVDDPTGYIYTEIGRWTSDNFFPATPGNILATGCIGNYYLTRI